MDLPATLEPVTDSFSQGDGSQKTDGSSDEPIWGRLLPLKRGFGVVELRKPTYVFGRSSSLDDVDVTFDNDIMRGLTNFVAFSKIHFKLYREEAPTPHTVIEDVSSNGTFLNGTKIGKDKRQVLKSNDEIAMALPHYRSFVYIENVVNEYDNAPIEMKQKFIISSVLGRGAMGDVRLVYAKESWTRAAVKIVSKTRLLHPGHSVDVSEAVAREIDILRSLNHPCVVQVLEVFDTDDKAFIVMELIDGGELFKRIVNSENSRLQEPIAKLYFYQMLHAIKYLHEEGITHRDLKPENILLASEDVECLVKITDFGLSKFIDSSSMLKTICGTPLYVAPEVVKSNGCETYTMAVDIWSLGVILFVILSGYMPFSTDYKETPLRDQILQGRYRYFPLRWHNVSSKAFEFVKKLLTVNPSSRPTAAEALQNEWFKDEEMKRKAEELMYGIDGMAEMKVTTKKRRAIDDTTENGSVDNDHDDDNNNQEPDSSTTSNGTTKKPCYA